VAAGRSVEVRQDLERVGGVRLPEKRQAALLVERVAHDGDGALERVLGQQEQPAGDEDQVPSGDLAAQHAEQRGGQAHDPGQREQQQDPRDHRARPSMRAWLRAAG